MNMFKPIAARTVDEYMSQLTPERKQILDKLDAIIKKAAPSLHSNFSYNMPGYGAFEYVNYKKEKVQWPVISVASQKNYVSVYVCSIDDGVYVAEKYKNDLGKVSVGKSCIRFKKLEQVNLKTLEKIIKIAEKFPGLQVKK